MALKIRLQRHGASHRPFYRMVVTEAAARRDGRFVEVLGTYEPQASKPENELLLKLERIDYWKSVGAKATDTAASLIRRARRGHVDAPNEAPKPKVEAPEPEAEAEVVEAVAEETAAEPAEEPAAEAEAAAPAEDKRPDCGCGNTQDPDGKCDGSHAKKVEVADAAPAEPEAAASEDAPESKEAEA